MPGQALQEPPAGIQLCCCQQALGLGKSPKADGPNSRRGRLLLGPGSSDNMAGLHGTGAVSISQRTDRSVEAWL